MINSIIRYLFAPIAVFRINKISGLENLPPKGPFLIAANHISFLDPLLIGALVLKQTGEKVYFLTKWEVYRHYGSFIGKKILGMIPIKPDNKVGSLETALSLLKKNRVVGVYPEGVRSTGQALLKGKTGAARLTLWSKCPVVPIGYQGSTEKGVFDAVRLFFSRKREIKITIGQPLELASYYHREINHELLEKVTSLILKEVSKLCGKEYPS